MRKKYLLILAFISTICHALVGGTHADTATFPSSVIYIQNGCTATLVSNSKILLAAHCVLPYQNTILYRKNSLIRFHRSAVAIENAAIEANISKVDIHPEWLRMIQSGKSMNQFVSNKSTVDLAVITISKISRPIPNHFFIPLNYNPILTGDEVIIGGYGCESFGQPNRNPRYKYAWKAVSKINGNHFITNSKNLRSQNKSMGCDGDSGGPVFLRSNGRLSIVGLNSFISETSSKGNFITGHVQISLFKDWLNQTLN